MNTTFDYQETDVILQENKGFPLLQTLQHNYLNLVWLGEANKNCKTRRYCQLSATNDVEAILCWLNEYRSIQTTYRTYQKEVERFLLWCIYKHKKILSDINRNDIEFYRQFLDKPDPNWCAPKGAKRGSPKWRPFVTKLKPQAQHQAFVILQSLFTYLYEANYLAANPLQLIRKKGKLLSAVKNPAQMRVLDDEEWEILLEIMENWPANTKQELLKKQRLKIIVYFLYFLGLRVSELVSCKWSDFSKINNDWWLFVIGKGGKSGKIPVNDTLFLAIAEYRIQLGKGIEPGLNENEPVLTRLEEKALPITTRYVNVLLKEISHKAMEKFIDQPSRMNKLRAFSAHWLRHQSGTMQDRAGIKDTYIKENHRHAKIDTTRQYIHAIDKERHREMNKLRLKPYLDIVSTKRRLTWQR